MTQAATPLTKIPTKSPQPGRGRAVRPAAGKILGSGTGRAATRGGGEINPRRRHRTSPRAVKRARHNNYRVKKPGEAASTRHDGPATIHIHHATPRAA
jgi:hypothetical protein